MEKYKFRLQDRFGEVYTSPLDIQETGLKWSDASEDALRDYTLEFDGSIVLVGEAFERLLRIEKSVYRCTEQYFFIDMLYTNSGQNVYNNIYRGVILLNNCTWDLVNCTVTVKFSKDTEYKCLEDSNREKINIISTLNAVEVDIFQSGVQLEYIECSGSTVNGEWIGPTFCRGGTASEGLWSVMESTQTWGPPAAPGEVNQYIYYFKWAREVLILDCGEAADFGWQPIEECINGKQKYARYASYMNCTRDEEWDTVNGFQYLKTKCESMLQGGSTVLRNGQTLENVLTRLISNTCGFPIKSDFFQINPENESNINYVTNNQSTTNNIVVFQKSDVKRPLDFNAAIRGETTFNDFMEMLNFLFNVDYRLENGVLEIEHVSFFNKNKGLDLTEERYKEDTDGVMEYSYKNEDVPFSETWRVKEGSYGAFSEQLIIYPSNCVVDKTITKEYLLDDFMTDVNYCFNNPDSDSDRVEDKGFVIVSTRMQNGRRYINGPQSSGQSTSLNGVFAIADLVNDYHFYERPLISGQINNVPVVFKSAIPIKKGVPVNIPLCCGQEFNPNDYIVTQLGNGIVDSATFNLESQTIDLDLVYSADEDLTPNEPPTITGIAKSIYIDETITIDMFQSANDPEGKLMGYEIVTQPTKGIIEQIDNRFLKYTPTEVGGDYFLFCVFDEWSEKSNNSTLSITIKADNLPPVANDDYYSFFNNVVTTVPNNQGLFINDHDDNGFELDSYDSITSLGGSVVVNSGGGFVYTPPVKQYGSNRNYILNSKNIVPNRLLSNNSSLTPLTKGKDELGEYITQKQLSTGKTNITTYFVGTTQENLPTFSEAFKSLPNGTEYYSSMDVMSPDFEIILSMSHSTNSNVPAVTLVKNEWSTVFNKGLAKSDPTRPRGLYTPNPLQDIPEGVRVYVKNYKVGLGSEITPWVPAVEDNTDTFTYTIVDERGLKDTATVYITLLDPAQIETTPKTYITWQDETINANGLLPNHVLIEGDTTQPPYMLEVLTESKPTENGNVVINSNGSFVYTPSPGFVGVDSFTYTAINTVNQKVENVIINVVNNIYVDIYNNSFQFNQLTDVCNGVVSLVGNETRAESILSFYSDPEKTIPIDVTGLGLRIKVKITRVINEGTPIESELYSQVVEGTTFVLYSNYEAFYIRNNCENVLTEQRSQTNSIVVGQGYKI